MDWNDLPDIDQEFQQSLATFDWTQVHSIMESVVARIPDASGSFPLLFMRRFLRGLRRKRRYADLLNFCRALLAAPSPENLLLINRDYAQALIESGDLNGAEKLSALGDGVVIGVDDLVVDAEFGGGDIGGIGLLQLVVVLFGHESDQKFEFPQGILRS